jgi:glucose/arabinose dehydrogenase
MRRYDSIPRVFASVRCWSEGQPAMRRFASIALVGVPLAALSVFPGGRIGAQVNGPVILVSNLAVRTTVTGLAVPTTMAFLGPDDILVLEKNTGRVQRVRDGVIESTVLDLAVNSASERGLLGIALHPEFPAIPWVYLYWTESTTPADTNVLAETPLLGNRVDRFVWDGMSLLFDRHLISLRALQPENPPVETRAFGNHDGGVLRFGPDGRLYLFIGDMGRRGQLQNLPCGPTPDCPGTTVPDDQFGGPEPDDAHLTGVVLRLNEDGSAPMDNPFFDTGAAIGGEVGASVQRIFSYGHRNGFGMAFDPNSGHLWLQENGDDSFSEINRIEPGMNGGWIQIAGPVGRISQFKQIETTFGAQSLQQNRWRRASGSWTVGHSARSSPEACSLAQPRQSSREATCSASG